jgi:DNA polymerase-3 subunit epsilon
VTWHLGTPLAAFDLETTGVQVESDRVVTACIAVIRPTPIPPWDVEVNTWLIDPGVEIPAGAIEVHGITNERARRDGRNPVGALDEIAATLASAQAEGIPIVGANLAYDNTLLDRGLRRHNLRTVEDRLGRPLGPCIDVQVLDKHVDPYRRKAEGNRKLETLPTCTAAGWTARTTRRSTRWRRPGSPTGSGGCRRWASTT